MCQRRIELSILQSMRTTFLVNSVAILIVSLSFQLAAGQTLKTAEDYNNRGLDRQRKGDLDGAIDDYTKAVGLKAKPSTIATAYNNRANARLNKNDLEGAIADYTKAIEIQPTNYENYYNRGVARMTQGDNEGAIEDFSRAIEMSPTAKARPFWTIRCTATAPAKLTTNTSKRKTTVWPIRPINFGAIAPRAWANSGWDARILVACAL